MKVTLSLPHDEDQKVFRQIHGNRQRENCTDVDESSPLIECCIPDENIVDGMVKNYQGELTVSLFLGGRTKSITFDPNGSTLV